MLAIEMLMYNVLYTVFMIFISKNKSYFQGINIGEHAEGVTVRK